MKWISVDPGVSGTGVAVWQHGDVSKRPTHTFALNFAKKDPYMEKLDLFIKVNNIKQCICEDAEYYKGSAKGEACATGGGLIVLARFIGSLEEVCRVNNTSFTLVTAKKWKGQLPKDVCAKRIFKIWPSCPAKPSHVVDAVGIGLWKLGLL